MDKPTIHLCKDATNEVAKLLAKICRESSYCPLGNDDQADKCPFFGFSCAEIKKKHWRNVIITGTAAIPNE